ncbi:type II secretion system F family protein [Chromohalobacter sp. 296-RDG]|uniref:type II secretion system F family protein n=1 Tax=Chromohalobacter sp. 296-RDG TaxID=2994062 RepID=UPI002468D5C6|nr:type II secretion system F family protein [Chromohalobacter sp. 296-RDG]
MAVASRSKAPRRVVLHRWRWKGKNSRGETIQGELVAADEMGVRQELGRQNILVKRIQRVRSPFGLGRIRPQDITLFARQMATMIRAGIPLLQAFSVVSESLKRPAMHHLIEILMNEVSAGASFSEALSQHPQHFDRMFVNMVEAGEQSGSLDRMLERVASYKEKIDSLRSRVRKALYYPAAVVLVGMGVTALLLVKVVPQFESLFRGFGADLPAFTQLTIHLSTWVQAYWPHVLGAFIAAGLLIRLGIRRSPRFAYHIDGLILRLPVIGDILDKSSVARFSRTLATTFSAGVPLVESLHTAAGSTGNRIYQRAINEVREHVASGQQLNFAMRATGRFPNLAVQMIGVGEESGALDAMLNKVADFYEEDVDTKVDALTSLLEPFIIVVLGVLVGGLVVSMYLPIFEMGSAI